MDCSDEEALSIPGRNIHVRVRAPEHASFASLEKNCGHAAFPFVGRGRTGTASRDVMQRRLAIN